MKALTLWQPWASLVMLGAKPYEFRSWPAPDFAAGQRIVIHAAARQPKMSELYELLRDLGTDEDGSYLDVEVARPFLEKCNTGLVCNRPLEFRCGLGTAMLGRPVRAIDIPEIASRGRDRVDPGMWAWPLSGIRRWQTPVDCSGAQGFWNWPLPIGENP